MTLTPREHEVLVARCQHGTDKATAAALDISRQTLRNHLRSIHDKYGETSTLRVIVIALLTGELHLDEIAA